MLLLLKLLMIIETNHLVETYRYFPDVALSGGCFIEKEDLDYLLTKEETKADSFRKSLELSNRDETGTQSKQACLL